MPRPFLAPLELRQKKARRVAELLVESNLVGHDSHGIIRVSQYVATIERGEIDPHAEVAIESETEASAVLDGHWGFGQVVMSPAASMAVEKAARCGVAALTVRNANHIGRLGSYVEDIARRGMVGLLFANMHGSAACVVPWGGREGRLGTNPLAAGLPRPNADPIVLDMTTSVVAEEDTRSAQPRCVGAGGVDHRRRGRIDDRPGSLLRPPSWRLAALWRRGWTQGIWAERAGRDSRRRPEQGRLRRQRFAQRQRRVVARCRYRALCAYGSLYERGGTACRVCKVISAFSRIH